MQANPPQGPDRGAAKSTSRANARATTSSVAGCGRTTLRVITCENTISHREGTQVITGQVLLPAPAGCLTSACPPRCSTYSTKEAAVARERRSCRVADEEDEERHRRERPCSLSSSCKRRRGLLCLGLVSGRLRWRSRTRGRRVDSTSASARSAGRPARGRATWPPRPSSGDPRGPSA
jgi:hypothetical protein